MTGLAVNQSLEADRNGQMRELIARTQTRRPAAAGREGEVNGRESLELEVEI